MSETRSGSRTASSVRRQQSQERQSAITGGRSLSVTPSGKFVVNTSANIVGQKMLYSDYNFFRREDNFGKPVQSQHLLIKEDKANELG